MKKGYKNFFYVIMPVGVDIDAPEKKRIIENISGKINVHPHFPEYRIENINRKVNASIKEIKGALFVLADLSMERPSCYYELGVAEALKKEVFLIAKEDSDIHQTQFRDDVLFFSGMEEFAKVVESIFSRVVSTRKKIRRAS